MFDHLKNSASSGKKAAKRSNVEIPRTVAFLGALKDNNLRLSYAALADAAEALGEHTATGLSAGQRGSKLLGGIPGNLQPYICNASGGYRKGMEWSEAPDVSAKALRSLGHVRPEALGPFIDAFIAATDETEEEVAPEAIAEPSEDESSEG